MQQDFHFYAIYTLARVAGIEDENAQIIAYASQYTDDAKSENRLRFVGGGSYQPIMTAHKFLTRDILSHNVFLNIFIPFHFLPGNVEEEGFYDKLICLSDSLPAREMVMDLLSKRNRPYFFHRLGIILHTYADTWAHQNFSGMLRKENEVHDLKVDDEIIYTEEYFDENWMNLKINLIPSLGHGQVGIIPDIPYKIWEYRNHKGKIVKADNIERFLLASKAIFQILCLVSESSIKCGWEEVQKNLLDIFTYKGSLKQRIANWKVWLKSGKFGFEKEYINYDSKLWQNEAIQKTDEKKNAYGLKEGFRKSNWAYFNCAAYFHRFYILYNLLPRYDIYCS